jgi:FixJ family two-component response regulator
VTLAAPLVYLVDDDASFLKSLSRLLRASRFSVAAFGSGAELLAHLKAASRGCIIADLNMPGLSGLDLQDELLKRGLGLPIIFLTGQGDIPSSVQAMRLGAEDFLEKLAPQSKLLDAVNRALAREAREHARRSALDALTPRERQVLEQVVRGRLNKQIAADLKIHERTVKLHRTAITTKLGVQSVAELTRLAHFAGVLEAEPATTFP